MTTTADEPLEGELAPDVLVPPAPSEELVRRDPVSLFELDQRRANVYAESGYWPDAKSQAQALVKIEAGREFGLPAFTAMSEVHVIQGKPTLGAGALATLVKTSGRYDYRVVEHTEERCMIRFLELDGDVLGESVFTLDDARKAGLTGRSTWKQYPRNMLFARALSNGVAWYCPDVSAGRVYTPEEIDGSVIVEADLVESEAVEEPDAPASGGPIPDEIQPTAEQKARISELIAELRALEDRDWGAWCRDYADVASFADLDEAGAARLINGLERVQQQVVERKEAA